MADQPAAPLALAQQLPAAPSNVGAKRHQPDNVEQSLGSRNATKPIKPSTTQVLRTNSYVFDPLRTMIATAIKTAIKGYTAAWHAYHTACKSLQSNQASLERGECPKSLKHEATALRLKNQGSAEVKQQRLKAAAAEVERLAFELVIEDMTETVEATKAAADAARVNALCKITGILQELPEEFKALPEVAIILEDGKLDLIWKLHELDKQLKQQQEKTEKAATRKAAHSEAAAAAAPQNLEQQVNQAVEGAAPVKACKALAAQAEKAAAKAEAAAAKVERAAATTAAKGGGGGGGGKPKGKVNPTGTNLNPKGPKPKPNLNPKGPKPKPKPNGTKGVTWADHVRKLPADTIWSKLTKQQQEQLKQQVQQQPQPGGIDQQPFGRGRKRTFS
jgi:hypothetical protein